MQQSGTLRGGAYLLAAVALFALVDGFSKILVETQSFGQVMLSRYAVAMAAVLIYAALYRPALFATRHPVLQVVRGLTPVAVGGSMVLAVKYLPLAEATTILFAGPVVVVVLSGWLLGERVGLVSWVGVALGFAAVLVVARPGLSGLSVHAVYPAIAALFYAALQLLSRQMSVLGESTGTMLAWTLAVGTVVSVPLALADWRPMTGAAWAISLALGAAFGGGQLLLARAFALAPANLLAPLGYAQILAAALFGLAVYGAVPDRWTVLGIALIVASAFLVLRRDGPAH
jgi:drug/metabolite transporter (DMT)-like permease